MRKSGAPTSALRRRTRAGHAGFFTSKTNLIIRDEEEKRRLSISKRRVVHQYSIPRYYVCRKTRIGTNSLFSTECGEFVMRGPPLGIVSAYRDTPRMLLLLLSCSTVCHRIILRAAAEACRVVIIRLNEERSRCTHAAVAPCKRELRPDCCTRRRRHR